MPRHVTAPASTPEQAEAKRTLEKLVIHKGKFKGKTGVQDDGKISAEELADLLQGAGAAEVNGSNEVMSEQELALVLDRQNVTGEGKCYRFVAENRRGGLLSTLVTKE
jgi:hypothetical protein